MSAELTTRTCALCNKDFSFMGWRLDTFCPSCRNIWNIRQAAKVTCDHCGGPKPPSLTSDLCDRCFRETHVANIEKWGSS